jgi:hypothetical protein
MDTILYFFSRRKGSDRSRESDTHRHTLLFHLSLDMSHFLVGCLGETWFFYSTGEVRDMDNLYSAARHLLNMPEDRYVVTFVENSKLIYHYSPDSSRRITPEMMSIFRMSYDLLSKYHTTAVILLEIECKITSAIYLVNHSIMCRLSKLCKSIMTTQLNGILYRTSYVPSEYETPAYVNEYDLKRVIRDTQESYENNKIYANDEILRDMFYPRDYIYYMNPNDSDDEITQYIKRMGY